MVMASVTGVDRDGVTEVEGLEATRAEEHPTTASTTTVTSTASADGVGKCHAKSDSSEAGRSLSQRMVAPAAD